ncbi:GTP-binding protein EsdC [Halenospora varia]|nr:GTP-binding protein EsdC [Halenospora varia]
MISTRTSFTLKTPTTIRCAHILGSWDLYSRHLPLMKVKEDKEASTWNNTFEFQVTILQPGKRYWYYYILNGYQVAYDSKNAVMIEPTTGRILNILDVPSDESTSKSLPRENQRDIPKGQPLEQCQIVAPVPVSSGPSRISSILYNETSDTVEDLTCKVGAVALDCVDIEADSNLLDDQGLPHPFLMVPANSPVSSHRSWASKSLH